MVLAHARIRFSAFKVAGIDRGKGQVGKQEQGPCPPSVERRWPFVPLQRFNLDPVKRVPLKLRHAGS